MGTNVDLVMNCNGAGVCGKGRGLARSYGSAVENIDTKSQGRKRVREAQSEPTTHVLSVNVKRSIGVHLTASGFTIPILNGPIRLDRNAGGCTKRPVDRRRTGQRVHPHDPHAEPAAQGSRYRVGLQRPAMKAESGAVLYVLGKTTFTCARRTPGW